MNTKTMILAALVLSASSCCRMEEPAILPKPVSIQMKCGRTCYNAEKVRTVVDTACGIPEEGYLLKVGRRGVTITASSQAGIIYGRQTLAQLLPTGDPEGAKIPCLEILDWPRFGWRGLHLDVSRHFFDATQVKRFIDVMSMYKFNRFHWHLTDDQGWRIEIKSHPELTEKGAWRSHVGFVKNQELGFNEDDGQPYGGFYTQDEIRDVVAYAAARGITVLPEIDLPGHSLAAIHAIPGIFCFPAEKKELRLEGGVSDGVLCAGKELTFKVMEDVLREVMDLFPSEYIHLGGDEAPKGGWKRCPDCQRRMKAEGLANENELQAYFMKRLEKFLISNGRRMIGWDEIMDGGLSESATVMSWRGILPGMEAAQGGNDVIMTPGSYVYFDAAQSVNPVTKAEGGLTSLRKVYSFDPEPDGLPEEAVEHILGLQACQWTEHTPTEEILYYREYPRAIAVAEIGWTPWELRDWDDFSARLKKHLPRLDAMGIGYGDPCYDVTISMNPIEGVPMVSFSAEVPVDIYYTLDGTDPDLGSEVYSGPFEIKKDCCIKACTFLPDGTRSRVASESILFHKALGKEVNYALPYSSKHNGGGKYAMTDGITGKWQGFEKQDADFTVDLGSVQTIGGIRSSWMYDISDWVLRPMKVSYLVSEDGVNFTDVLNREIGNPSGEYGRGTIEVGCKVNAPVRYIRVKAASEKINPEWHSSAGAACWIFVDEIIVY